MLTQSRRTLDKVYRTETVAYSAANYHLKKLHQKSDDISVLLHVEKRGCRLSTVLFEFRGYRRQGG